MEQIFCLHLTGIAKIVNTDTHLRRALKGAVQGLAALSVLTFADLAGFGRFSSAFQGFAYLVALVLGLPAIYLRVA